MSLVCVTGGTGYLGQHLVSKLLKRGTHIRVLTRRPETVRSLWPLGRVEPWQGDLAISERLRGFTENAEVVYHLAGETRDVSHLNLVNVMGTKNLLEACCCKKIKRFVHLSSVGVIGARGEGKVDESAPCRPRNKYQKSKYASELVVLAAFKNLRLPVTIVRPSIVFGEGIKQGHDSFAAWLKTIRKGWFRFIGSRDAVANYVYVEDVVQACLGLADSLESVGKVYIVSDSCSMHTFVGSAAEFLGAKMPGNMPVWLAYGLSIGLEMTGKVVNFSAPLTVSRVRALRSRVVYSSDKLREELPFKPVVGWREGLRRTIEWYKRNNLLS